MWSIESAPRNLPIEGKGKSWCTTSPVGKQGAAITDVTDEMQNATGVLEYDSTFVELCALSERLEAVEASEERRVSIGTTASWGSLPSPGTFNVPTDCNRTREVFADEEDDWYAHIALGPYTRPRQCLHRLAPIGPPSPIAISEKLPVDSGIEFSVRELVDYLMEQLPLPDCDVENLSFVAEAATPPSPSAEQGGDLLDQFPLGVTEAVETIDRILKSGMLSSSSTRASVSALVDYHLGCIHEERDNPLPEIPRVDHRSFWSLPSRRSSFP